MTADVPFRISSVATDLLVHPTLFSGDNALSHVRPYAAVRVQPKHASSSLLLRAVPSADVAENQIFVPKWVGLFCNVKDDASVLTVLGEEKSQNAEQTAVQLCQIGGTHDCLSDDCVALTRAMRRQWHDVLVCLSSFLFASLLTRHLQLVHNSILCVRFRASDCIFQVLIDDQLPRRVDDQLSVLLVSATARSRYLLINSSQQVANELFDVVGGCSLVIVSSRSTYPLVQSKNCFMHPTQRSFPRIFVRQTLYC